MKRRCVWCRPPHILAEVPPLSNPNFTDGMCAKAAKIENAKIDAMRPVKMLAVSK